MVAYRDYEAVVCGDPWRPPRFECPGGGYLELEAYLEGFLVKPPVSDVLAWAESNGLDCLDATTLGRRYVYVTFNGPSSPPEVSVEAAVEAYRHRIEQYANFSSYIQGSRMGYDAPMVYYDVEPRQDALVVLEWSVSVIDGVVRGEALNHSERLWARNAAVTATDPAGAEHTWRYPLTVQPGETMPFEIEGWTGSQSPSEVALAVSADMSPRIDLTRSLRFTRNTYYLSAEFLSEEYPEAWVGSEIPDGVHEFSEVRFKIHPSGAHPRLKLATEQQTIENLVVYAATYTSGTLTDVFEMTPMGEINFDEDPNSRWAEISGLGVELPNIGITRHARVGVLLGEDKGVILWAGGADA